jgi:hypothetical protein
VADLRRRSRYVLVTWPGGSVTRTVTGSTRISNCAAWCDEFNRISAAQPKPGSETALPPGVPEPPAGSGWRLIEPLPEPARTCTR